MGELVKENEALKQRVSELKREQKTDRTTMEVLQAKTNFPPVDFIMPNFEQRKKNCDAWYSPPFYTHHRGYKLCLRCYTSSIYVKNHVSVYVYMMQGEFDDELKWPLRGQVTIQLLSHDASNEHHTKTITLDNPKCYSRVTMGDRSIGGRGELGFISHDECYKGYIKSDSLHFRIFKSHIEVNISYVNVILAHTHISSTAHAVHVHSCKCLCTVTSVYITHITKLHVCTLINIYCVSQFLSM